MAGKKKVQRNDRKTKSFITRYGMTRAQWSEFKKENSKQDVEALRSKAISSVGTRAKVRVSSVVSR